MGFNCRSVTTTSTRVDAASQHEGWLALRQSSCDVRYKAPSGSSSVIRSASPFTMPASTNARLQYGKNGFQHSFRSDLSSSQQHNDAHFHAPAQRYSLHDRWQRNETLSTKTHIFGRALLLTRQFIFKPDHRHRRHLLPTSNTVVAMDYWRHSIPAQSQQSSFISVTQEPT